MLKNQHGPKIFQITKISRKNILNQNWPHLSKRSHIRALNDIFRFDPPTPPWRVGGVKKSPKWHFWRVWVHFEGSHKFTEQNECDIRIQHEIFKIPNFQPGANSLLPCVMYGGLVSLMPTDYRKRKTPAEIHEFL